MGGIGGGFAMKYAILIMLVAAAAFAGPMDIYVDCEGNTKLDLVFVIDSSGSMSSSISNIKLVIP